jgi:hypothetical protein
MHNIPHLAGHETQQIGRISHARGGASEHLCREQPMEAPMRVFFISALVAVVLAVAFSATLGVFQESSADAYATSSTRLDHQEAVNSLGREAG